jgi:hypothetical protein
MPDDPLSAAERYRKAAAEFADLAKSAANPFFCGYYQRLAERYLLHAENQMKLSKITGAAAAEPGGEDSPSVEVDREAPAVLAAAPRAGRRRRRRSGDQVLAERQP